MVPGSAVGARAVTPFDGRIHNASVRQFCNGVIDIRGFQAFVARRSPARQIESLHGLGPVGGFWIDTA
ncbi:MAG: hypothetical protein AB8B64_25165 [Granulosicoccus sp.]